MKKLLLLGTFLVLMALAPATEAQGPKGKATGGVNGIATSTTNTDVSFQFNAHEKGPKGMVSFATGWGGFFHGEVDCFKQMNDNTVCFSGEITMTNVDGWDYFIAFVQDNGEPGDFDWFRVSPGVYRPCTEHPWASEGVPLNEQWPVTEGNIQVH